MTTTESGTRRSPVLRGMAIAACTVLWCATVALLSVGTLWAVLVVATAALALTAGLAASLLLARKFVAVAVRGGSMEPTFRDGDWVLVRRGQHPARGQVVVAEQPPADLPLGARRLPSHVPASATAVPLHRWVVKRVAAVPGDPVPRDRVPALADVPECRVPPGKLILLGDNLRASFDSRRLGYYSVDRVLGVVVRKLTIRRKQPYAGYPPSAAGR